MSQGSDPQPLCKNCRFWLRDKELVHWPPAGECRLHPPEAVTCHFPRTSENDWCGDHAYHPNRRDGEW
jgi:hypothetical protein